MNEQQLRLLAIEQECSTLSVAGENETPEAKTARETKLDALLEEAKGLQAEVLKAKARQEQLSSLSGTVETLRKTPVNGLDQRPKQEESVIKFPRHTGTLALGNTEKAREEAYYVGRYIEFLKGGERGQKAFEYLKERGHMTLAMSTIDNTAGGYLVPDVVSASIIRLVEDRGVARRNARMIPLGGGENKFPRRITGTTGYFVGESSSTTQSNPTLDLVQLNPKKLSAKTTMPVELSEDAIINVGDWAAEEIAYAFADTEDACMFIGDGTSTYGGMTGITKKLIDTFTTGGGKGLYLQATGDEFSEVVRGDLVKTKALALATVLRSPNCKWYMHSVAFAQIVEALVLEAGGVTSDMWANGAQPRLLGYPVEFVQVMPSESADNQVFMVFGDLRQGTYFGEKGSIWLRTSQEGDDFDNDTITIKGSERIDIVNHGVGSTSQAGFFVGAISGS